MKKKNYKNKINTSLSIVLFVLAIFSNLIVAEPVVDFEEVGVNQSREKTIVLSNRGDMVLNINNIYFENETSEFLIGSDTSFSIAGGDSVAIPIKFNPNSAGEKEVSLVIESNDPEKKTAYVTLKGNSLKNAPATETHGSPDQFKLIQNYPNPFNSSTTFKFQVAEPKQIKITIYDVTGQKIKTVENENMNPGYYETRWNGTNEYGQNVSSGAYIARMQAGNFNENVVLTRMN